MEMENIINYNLVNYHDLELALKLLVRLTEGEATVKTPEEIKALRVEAFDTAFFEISGPKENGIPNKYATEWALDIWRKAITKLSDICYCGPEDYIPVVREAARQIVRDADEYLFVNDMMYLNNPHDEALEDKLWDEWRNARKDSEDDAAAENE